jgi:hypothetical protein
LPPCEGQFAYPCAQRGSCGDLKLFSGADYRLGNRIRSLVGSFDASTPPEKYREYDALQKEVERLYGEWKQ